MRGYKCARGFEEAAEAEMCKSPVQTNNRSTLVGFQHAKDRKCSLVFDALSSSEAT